MDWQRNSDIDYATNLVEKKIWTTTMDFWAFWIFKGHKINKTSHVEITSSLNNCMFENLHKQVLTNHRYSTPFWWIVNKIHIQISWICSNDTLYTFHVFHHYASYGNITLLCYWRVYTLLSMCICKIISLVLHLLMPWHWH